MKTPLTTPLPVAPGLGGLLRRWGRWPRARSLLIRVSVPLLGLIVAFGIGAVMLTAAGADPVVAYRALFHGAFGTRQNFFETLVKAAPIMFAAIGVSVAFRCSVWNIGAEGQIHVGAIGATLAGLALRNTGLPALVGVPFVMLAGFTLGGLYASIAGVLRARWKVNEVISTVMLNFVGVLLVQYLAFGPMRDVTAQGMPMSELIAEAAEFPRLVPRSRLHLGVFLAMLAGIVTYILLFKTTLGYKIRAVGINPLAAEHAGINVPNYVFLAMLISGGLAGLAGTSEISGLHFRLLATFSAGFGAAATIVAKLGDLNPLLIVPTAILFGGLLNGADAMARAVQVSTSIVIVIQGLLVLFVMGSQYFVSRWESRHVA
jgi:simple sugar transport system permease protein